MNNNIESVNVTPELPQTGWHLSDAWAEKFNIADKTFRELCKKNSIPHKMVGSKMIVKAELLYEYSPSGLDDEDG